MPLKLKKYYSYSVHVRLIVGLNNIYFHLYTATATITCTCTCSTCKPLFIKPTPRLPPFKLNRSSDNLIQYQY